MTKQRTFVMIKPDGVRRNLIGEIISRLEGRDLDLVAMKLIEVNEELAQNHYSAHSEKPFFSSLIEYITSGPVVAMVWEGPNAVKAVRKLMGSTDPLEASPGSIRGDFALDIEQNLVHGSDSPESASREISLFFSGEELMA